METDVLNLQAWRTGFDCCCLFFLGLKISEERSDDVEARNLRNNSRQCK